MEPILGSALVAGGVSLAKSIGDLLFGASAREEEKEMQETAWKREDASVQRRVADLKAAGLSPVLAAGQGASTMAPIRPTVPHTEGNPVESALGAASMVMKMLEMKTNISNTEADTNVKNVLAHKMESEKTGQDIRNVVDQGKIDASIEEAKQHAKGEYYRTLGAAVDVELKRQGVTLNDIQLAKERLNQEKGFLELSEQEQDIASKKLAIKVSEYNLKYAKNAMLPAGASPNLAATIPAMGGQIFGAIIEEVMKLFRKGK